MRFFNWLRNWTRTLRTRRPSRRTSRVRPRLEHLERRDVPSANLLADINNFPNSSLPADPADVNGTLYFTAVHPVSGALVQREELWKSDGTEAGTVLVKRFASGLFGSHVMNLTAFNNSLYFMAHDDAHGMELWKSDGTEAG